MGMRSIDCVVSALFACCCCRCVPVALYAWCRFARLRLAADTTLSAYDTSMLLLKMVPCVLLYAGKDDFIAALVMFVCTGLIGSVWALTRPQKRIPGSHRHTLIMFSTVCCLQGYMLTHAASSDGRASGLAAAFAAVFSVIVLVVTAAVVLAVHQFVVTLRVPVAGRKRIMSYTEKMAQLKGRPVPRPARMAGVVKANLMHIPSDGASVAMTTMP